ncbi:unnamed protein product, partial [Meganyctiphanes norvegica]
MQVLVLLLVALVMVLGMVVPILAEPRWKEETVWRDHNAKPKSPRRGPHVLPGLPTNVSVTVGRLATLPCRVANLKGRAVSWIRTSDLNVLSVDDTTFTSDKRFKVLAWRTNGLWAWDLQINGTLREDTGLYECQVNTRPKISHPVFLSVHSDRATIAGPSEKYVNAGSRLHLSCSLAAHSG